MNNVKFCSVILVFIMLIPACAKPFQPPPPAIEMWVKPGIEKEEVRKNLLDCGFPNAAGFVGSIRKKFKLSDEVRAEQCMFRKGYRYKDGWGGMCTIESASYQAACDSVRIERGM